MRAQLANSVVIAARRRLVAAALVLPWLVSCADDGGDSLPVCTTEARFGIVIHVVDAATRQALDQASGVLVSANYREVMQRLPRSTPAQPVTLAGATERAGTYLITVSHPGYRDWQRAGVVVTAGECHVNGILLTAELTAAAINRADARP